MEIKRFVDAVKAKVFRGKREPWTPERAFRNVAWASILTPVGYRYMGISNHQDMWGFPDAKGNLVKAVMTDADTVMPLGCTGQMGSYGEILTKATAYARLHFGGDYDAMVQSMAEAMQKKADGTSGDETR